MIESRLKNYDHLSKKLKTFDDQKLASLLKGSHISSGWGENHIANIDGHSVFIKSLPLTNLEFEAVDKTHNHFNLPLCYNYGFNSAGFGSFRELSAHKKTTQWVLDGECKNFPLLYHAQIIARQSPITKIDNQEHEEYIEYWNNSQPIDHYIKERAKAPYQLVLVLEHFPEKLGYRDWFSKNTHSIFETAEQMFSTLEFLNKKGVVHFDTHFHNILTNGNEVYLTDFGLALDQEDCKSSEELTFFNQNRQFDQASFVRSSAWQLCVLHEFANKELQEKINLTYGISPKDNFSEILQVLLQNLDDYSNRFAKLEPRYLAYLKEHIDVILESNDFACRFLRNTMKDDIFKLTEKSSQQLR